MVIIWIILKYWFPPTSEFQRKFRNTAANLNAIQLINALLLLSIAVYMFPETNWFDLRFLLDSTNFAGWSIVLSAMIMPEYFTRSFLKICGVAVFFTLELLLGLRLRHKLILSADHGCFSNKLTESVFKYSIIFWSLLLSMCIYLAVCNGEDSNRIPRPLNLQRWRIWGDWILIIIPSVGGGLELAFALADYSALELLIVDRGDDWTFAQILQLSSVALLTVLSLWSGLEVEGKL